MNKNPEKIPEKTGKTPDKTLKPGLYIVATPIGNLQDITLRALETLEKADIILCEDTRTSAKLLNTYGIKQKKISYNDHNGEQKIPSIIKKISSGKSIALISDAGTPLISDPGYKLVREIIKNNLYVTSIPGACALINALVISGLPCNNFTFAGFLPGKSQARKNELKKWKSIPSTLIFYETSSRLLKSIKDISAILGNRNISIAREITKIHEEVKTGKITELLEFYQKNSPPKGEIVLLISPDTQNGRTPKKEIEKMLKTALKTMSTKDACEMIAKTSGYSKKEIYSTALEILESLEK